jgi:hypothetical protein
MQTTPVSGIAPASEPASGLVSAKQGFPATRQTRQVVIFLLFSTVLQQFARA